MMMEFYLTIVLLLGVTVTPIVGLPNGAPVSACSTISPNHSGTSPSTDPLPYTVNISSLDDGYTPGQSYTIILSGTTTNADFQGFLVQARVMASDTATGTFTDNGDDQQLVCTGDTSVTHVNSNDKTMVQLMWNAPPVGTGTILFRYAIADSRAVYWPNQATGTVDEVIAVTTTTSTIDASVTTTSTIDASVITTSIIDPSVITTSIIDPSVITTSIIDPSVITTSIIDPSVITTSTTVMNNAPSTNISITLSTSTSAPIPSSVDIIMASTSSASATPTVTPDDGGATGVMAASYVMLMLLASIITLIN